jgi:hypothetical protein
MIRAQREFEHHSDVVHEGFNHGGGRLANRMRNRMSSASAEAIIEPCARSSPNETWRPKLPRENPRAAGQYPHTKSRAAQSHSTRTER